MKINSTGLCITPLAPFNFAGTATSHGWSELAPTAWDEDSQALQRTERLSTGKVVRLRITGSGTLKRPGLSVEVNHAGRLSPKDEQAVTTAVGHMFRAEEDLAEFYALCKKHAGQWTKAATDGLGRVLRSPTVFEDAVKTICTINIQWGGTKGMVNRLVNTYGEAFPGDPAQRAFPTPEAMAADSFAAFSKAARLGLRAPYVHTLARRVAAGELDLESLRTSSLPTPELRKELLTIKGVGNYAAASLLMFLGRYDELAVDTVFRAFVSQKYFGGQMPADKDAQALYAPWGRWKYLAYRFEIWQHYQTEA